MKPDPSLTVFGSFGFGNLGDELVPECFGHLLHAAGRTNTVQSMSRFHQIPPGPSAPYPTDAAPADLSNTHLIVAGGGIIEPRDMSCMNRAFALAERTPGLRVSTHAISVEPGVSFSWRKRRVLTQQLRTIGRVTVRDNLSAEILAGLVPGASIRVIGDIALWIKPEPVPAALEALLPERALPVILCDVWDTPDFYDWMATELVTLARDLDCAVLLLPFSQDYGNDTAIYTRLRARLSELAPDVEVAYPAETLPGSVFTPGIVATILERAPLSISMRLHGCVMSYAVGTPFLGIVYHPKLQGFAQTIGWSKALVPGVLPPAQSTGAYGYTFADLDIGSGALSKAADKVLDTPDFSAISYFRHMQKEALEYMLSARN